MLVSRILYGLGGLLFMSMFVINLKQHFAVDTAHTGYIMSYAGFLIGISNAFLVKPFTKRLDEA
jgi:hypothetical protein